jgi:hypothetical protein
MSRCFIDMDSGEFLPARKADDRDDAGEDSP